jgi:hypothetical protein
LLTPMSYEGRLAKAAVPAGADARATSM